ncbi:hypothetical protein F7725_014920 [Dissostichus mawsoni]|uniref:Polysaccharide biosynthesis domain-containing protein n=1 Tax=Dissostichus mawsoni TaxID=36200 RepID=A0A7J5YH13_DISMA|nr:hypothetical protein F7725_014910 [Dissostichus mawsoni]KAF3848423.1 hypothetical protein F7725_014920 [Dissostichus mawsoni]
MSEREMASDDVLGSLGVQGASAGAHALSLPADAYGNDFLKLTKMDDDIYKMFRETFKDLDIKKLNPDDLKSDEMKEVWRPFCNQFQGLIEDFNYGTLLRLDCERDYTEENTIFATRAQFFAVEVARNKEGCNDVVFTSKSSKSES